MAYTKKHTRTAAKAGKRSLIRRIVRGVGIGLVAVVLLAVFTRVAASTFLRATHDLSRKPNAIDRMEMVEIGGIQQALYFRGENFANPVILFLHGGPGSPMIEAIHGYQYDWEKDFTVVNWDQRMTGKTYYANDPKAVLPTMSFERVLEDAWEVTQYVQQQLGVEKIILMGHSWGSVLGTSLVQAHPDAYAAYIGVGQVTNMMDNERMGYDKALEAARNAGNAKDVAALEALSPYPPGTYDATFNDAVMTLRGLQLKYNLAGGMTPSMMWLGFTSPYYSIKELSFLLTDTLSNQEPIMRYLFEEYDVRDGGLTFAVPVFCVMGENDYQTPIPLAQQWYDEIRAPLKRFYSVPDAGHMTMLDNKDAFTRVLVEEIKPAIMP